MPDYHLTVNAPAWTNRRDQGVALLAEEAPPRDVADALAEIKARKIAENIPTPWS